MPPLPGAPGGPPPMTSGGPMPPKPPLPGNPAGGPVGPGATPALAPGSGAGNEAAADAMIKAMLPGLHKALGAYPVGSKKYGSLLNAIRALSSNFGKEDQGSLVPAAVLQMAMAARGGGPLSAAPPPGLQPAPPGGPGGAAPELPAPGM